MEKTNLFSRLVALPIVYDLSQTVFGGYRFKRKFVSNIASKLRGKRVLDIGCGTGFLGTIIPECQYVGVDIDAKSIERARVRAPDYCQFLCADAAEALDKFGPATFDIIVATGIFHHLSPVQCDRVLKNASDLLASGGKLYGFEPAYIDDQGAIARFIVSQDRGSNVLHVDDWKVLLGRHFKSIEANIKHDAFLQPYTLLMFELSNP